MTQLAAGLHDQLSPDECDRLAELLKRLPTAISLKEAEAAARQFQQRLDQNAAYDGNVETPSDGHNPPVSY